MQFQKSKSKLKSLLSATCCSQSIIVRQFEMFFSLIIVLLISPNNRLILKMQKCLSISDQIFRERLSPTFFLITKLRVQQFKECCVFQNFKSLIGVVPCLHYVEHIRVSTETFDQKHQSNILPISILFRTQGLPNQSSNVFENPIHFSVIATHV